MPRKTVRIEDLPPETRGQVQAQLDQLAAETRLRKLVERNTRIQIAAAQVDAGDTGRALEIIAEVLGKQKETEF